MLEAGRGDTPSGLVWKRRGVFPGKSLPAVENPCTIVTRACSPLRVGLSPAAFGKLFPWGALPPLHCKQIIFMKIIYPIHSSNPNMSDPSITQQDKCLRNS